MTKDNSLWIPVFIFVPMMLLTFVAFRSAKKNYHDKKEQGRINDFLESQRQGRPYIPSKQNLVESRQEFHFNQLKSNIFGAIIAVILFFIYKYFF